MELIWGIWFFFGLITGTLMFLGVSSANERLFEGKHDKHRPVPLPHGGDDRMGGSDPVHYQPTSEEINMVLNNFRVGASQKEKQIIDYLMDGEGDSHEEQNSTAKMD